MGIIVDLIFWLFFLGLVVGIWGLVANDIAGRKRDQLIDRWQLSGHYSLARDEYNRVTYNEHHWRVFTFRSACCLYGPLLQGVWNHSSNNMNTYDEWWWRCYNEIYLKLDRDGNIRRKTRVYMARGDSLPAALMLAGIDLDEWLLGQDKVAPPPKFAMTGGAEEYEQIIIAQELMEGL